MIVSRYSCRGCRQWNTPALAPETHPAIDTGRRPARWTTQDSRRPLPPPEFFPLLVGRGLGVQAPGPLAVFLRSSLIAASIRMLPAPRSSRSVSPEGPSMG